MLADEGVYRRCREAFGQLASSYRWSLIATSDVTFIEEVQQTIRLRVVSGQASDEVIKRAVKATYCIRLYYAYGLDGTEQQKLAMSEVKDFVYCRLLRTTRGDTLLADECAQKAVEQAWLKWRTVREPQSFLSFVLRIGIHEVFNHRRGEAWLEDVPDDSNGADRLVNELQTGDESLERSAEINDIRQRLVDGIRRCLQRKDEARLLIEIFIDGKTYNELVATWGKEAGYLQVLKFRALKNLRSCGEFLALKRDWSFE